MPTVCFDGKSYASENDESVLATLLRHRVAVPYSCRVGACRTCLLRRTDGPVPAEAQHGLRDTLCAQGYFLACRFFPDGDVCVARAEDADVSAPARVIGIEHIDTQVCRVALEPATPLYYHAGQYVNLVRDDGLSRSYSLASVPALDAHLEIHVQRFRNGRMSNWIHDHLHRGDSLRFQGPWGDCFYLPGREEQTLILVGTGTGLAPLIGIVRDALQSGHRGAIHLYHGSRQPQGLYLHDRLQRLAEVHDNVHYHACLSGDTVPAGYRRGRASDLALADFADLRGTRLYLCGNARMVHAARTQALQQGLENNAILADAFELTELRRKPR